MNKDSHNNCVSKEEYDEVVSDYEVAYYVFIFLVVIGAIWLWEYTAGKGFGSRLTAILVGSVATYLTWAQSKKYAWKKRKKNYENK